MLTNRNDRNQTIDIFRLLLIFMVVAIHVDVLSTFKELNFFIVDGYFRIAVPIFFIINGYFFQCYITDKKLFKKWLYRSSLLFMIWQVIYLPMYFPDDGWTPLHIAVFVSALLFGYHHLWYIAAMVTGGVMLYYVKHNKYTLILCVSLFLIGWFLQYVRIFFDTEGVLLKIFSQYWIFRNGLFFGFPMMFIGAYIAKNDVVEKFSQRWCEVVVVVSFFALSLELWLTSTYIFNKISYHIDFIISLLVFCPTLFILLMKSKKVYFIYFNSKDLALIASAVYFIHPCIIHLVEGYYSLSAVIAYVLTIGMSFLIAFVLFCFRKKLFFIF